MTEASMNPQVVLENEIIQQLQNNRKYFTSVIHHLKPEYFEQEGTKQVFKKIKDYYLTYKDVPTLKELVLSFRESPKSVKEAVKPVLSNLKEPDLVNTDQLLDQTEKWIKMAIFRDAIIEGADSLGKNDHESMKKSYSKAEEAIRVNLTSDLGVSLEEIDKIYEEMQDKPGILTRIPSFDKMLGSGITPKTLSAFAAASGVGKSAAMAAFAVQFLLEGKDVIIVTLEMSEAEFYKRIYANLFDIPVHQVKDVDRMVLKNKLQEVQDKIGKLVIKEYPTGALTPLGLDGFLDQLRTEKDIHNPVVFVDYLGIMGSDKVKTGDNSYTFYGSIAEELRSIAQKREIVMFTALQLNRSAVNNLEADQSTLSESMKILMTLDMMIIISQTKEMKEKGELKISFVKNRFSGKTWDFSIGFDYSKFRFIDNYNINGENITAAETSDPLANHLKSASLGGLMSL